MLEETDESRRDISNGLAARDLIETNIWGIIHQLLKDKADSVRWKMDDSDDPSVVMSCVRQINGIMFIDEVIHDIIERGDRAASEAAP